MLELYPLLLNQLVFGEISPQIYEPDYGELQFIVLADFNHSGKKLAKLLVVQVKIECLHEFKPRCIRGFPREILGGRGYVADFPSLNQAGLLYAKNPPMASDGVHTYPNIEAALGLVCIALRRRPGDFGDKFLPFIEENCKAKTEYATIFGH